MNKNKIIAFKTVNYFHFIIGFITTLFFILTISQAKENSGCTKHDWVKFKKAFGKRYANKSEDAIRRNIFCENLHYINEHNANRAVDDGFELGLNQMSDWNESEINTLIGYDQRPELERMMGDSFEGNLMGSIEGDHHDEKETLEIPRQLDWRNFPNRVGPVVNQGMCGACWAYATTGLLEGQQIKRMKKGNDSDFKLVPLSAQNLLDCDRNSGGCAGGVTLYALNFIRKNGGIETESDYPYISAKSGIIGMCRYEKSRIHESTKSIRGPSFVEPNNEAKLRETVATFGPVSVAMEASTFFIQYRGGVYYERLPRTGVLNHELLLIGYGSTESGEDYWIVKNSWGVDWGEAGFGRIARNRGNHSGIEEMPIIFRY